MFKRRGLYYILFGPFCCFCYQVGRGGVHACVRTGVPHRTLLVTTHAIPIITDVYTHTQPPLFANQGSGVRVYTARSPLGPYTFQGRDIACRSEQQQQQQQQASLSSSFSSSSASSNSGGWGVPIPQQPPYAAEPTPGQGCLFYGEGQASVTRAQQNFVIEVSTWLCVYGRVRGIRSRSLHPPLPPSYHKDNHPHQTNPKGPQRHPRRDALPLDGRPVDAVARRAQGPRAAVLGAAPV